MHPSKSSESLAKTRRAIAVRARELRLSRRWTQAELAKRLRLSQSRLSEIERGDGSFTAEQFLLLLRLFNVDLSDFIIEERDEGLAIQNALARLGALHVQETTHVLPSKQLEEAHDVVREALIDGDPRLVTALAPVLVRHAERMNLPKVHAELERIGRERRLGWLIDNTLAALQLLRRQPTRSTEWTKLDRRAAVEMELFLDFVRPRADSPTHRPLDVLDATIRSYLTLEEVQRSGSLLSQRWGIVTSLQPEDFLQALKAARASD